MSSSSKPPKLAIVGLVGLTLMWSYNWVVMKSVSHYIGAFDFAALRCVFGTAFLFLILRMRGNKLAPTPFLPTLLVGIFQLGGMAILAQWALVSGGAGKVAVLVYTMPFWMVLLAAFFLGERMRPFQYGAVGLAAIGIILVLQPWTMSSSWHGYVLAILSGISWAISAIISKKVYKKYPDIDVLAFTAWLMVYGSVLVTVVALLTPQPEPVWNSSVFLALAYNTIPATAVAFLLWSYLLKVLPASIAGLSTLAIPVCGVFWAWALLGDAPSLTDAVGICFIIFALGLISIPKRQAP